MTAQDAAAAETPQTYLAGLAAAGSAGMLAGAFMFQHLGGLPPCEMCIWQRWPHALAASLGLLMLIPLLRGSRLLRAVGAFAALTTAAIGLFHTGVERGWWEGPSTCSGGPASGLSSKELLDAIMAAPVVRCNDVAWQMLGLSMASWNALISLALAGLWIASLRR